MSTRPGADALFEPEGDTLVPTRHARGPWDPGALHGGAVAAAVVRALEAGDSPLPVARLSLELLRPVPLAPLAIEVSTLRPGRLVQVDEVEVRAEGRLVVAARAGRIRSEPVEVPAVASEALAPGPESSSPARVVTGGGPAFHTTAMELRFAGPDPEDARRRGEAFVWARLRLPVVAGEDPTGFQRAAAAADFGNGVSAPLSFETTTFINPDLAMTLVRPPEGEWVGMAARTRVGPHGRGLSESTLFDRHGALGRSAQSLLIAPR